MTAIAGAALDGAIRTEFLETYKSEYEVMEQELRDLAKLAVPSNKISERYVYFESAPHPKRQPRDQEMAFGDYAPKDFTVANHKFSMGIKIHEDDEEDDQTGGGLVERAGEIASNFALLPERLFWQLLLSTTDDELLPAIPNAPDGAALFSATDGGGGARFGATGGNIVSGSGVVTAQQVKANFFTAVARFGSFLDSKNSQPLIHRSKLKKFAIWFNIDNLEVFTEAFKAMQQVKYILAAVTGTDDVAGSISNPVKDAQFEVTLYPTPRISDNDWIIRASGQRHYSLFEQARSALREVRGDDTNSDSARLTGYRYMGWKERRGAGIGLPYDLMYVDNS